MRLLVWHGSGDPPADAGAHTFDADGSVPCILPYRVASRFATIATALSSLPETAPAIVIIDDEKCSRADLEALACTLGDAGAVPAAAPLVTVARFLVASDYLSCDELVSAYAAAYAQTLRAKSVHDIVAAGSHAELGMDLVRLIFAHMPAPAASMLCDAWASSTVCHGLLTPETARVLGAEVAVAAPADLVSFPPLRSPVSFEGAACAANLANQS
jgi:hypothetical protein